MQTSYDYDANRQLTGSSRDDGPGTPAIESYAYDEAGNRTADHLRPEYDVTAGNRYSVSYDDQGNETNYSYDGQGNLGTSEVTDGSADSFGYQYDSRQRLIKLTRPGG